MPETFAALLFAHVLADFVFQTRRMVETKRKPHVLALHGAIVFVLTLAVLGGSPALAGAVAAAHLAIDAAKTHALRRPGLAAFLVDQAAHLATIAVAAALLPGAWGAGLWAGLPAPLAGGTLPVAMLWIAGFLLATRAGGFAMALLMQAHPAGEAERPGLLGGGRTIGLLERALVFLLVLAGQPGGIGFLIAAKSILRFGAVGQDRHASEYVIVGTLASVGWALAVALAVQALLALPGG